MICRLWNNRTAKVHYIISLISVISMMIFVTCVNSFRDLKSKVSLLFKTLWERYDYVLLSWAKVDGRSEHKFREMLLHFAPNLFFFLLCLKSICLVVITSCRLIILILKFQTLSKGNNPQTTERNPLELNLITFDQ